MDILLIAGLWLDGSVWNDVVPALEELGHRPVALTLPGQGDGSASATLDDQLAAVVAAVDAAANAPMVVGHSAASTLAWLAADARPQRVAKVVFIGGFPNADGQSYADFFPVVDGAMPFPGWAPFEGAGQCRPRRGDEGADRRRGDPRARRRHQGRRATDRRSPLRRPGRPGLPGVHAGPGASSGSTPATSPNSPRRRDSS